MDNKNLNCAKKSKYDEFYIIEEDAYQVISGYSKQYANKVIYCNTDDYRISNVWKIFYENFHLWKLSNLIATGFNKKGHGIYAQYDGKTLTVKQLKGNGDFRSKECLDILMKCDFCITCPPFSLNREYLHLMYNSGKMFLTLSGATVCSEPWVIERFKAREMTRSFKKIGNPHFIVPKSYKKESDNIKVLADGTRITTIHCIWLTNILTSGFIYENIVMKKMKDTNCEFITTKNGEKILYPKTVNDVPVEYEGKIRLPITCVNYINPTTGFIDGVFVSEFSTVKQKITVLGTEKDITGDYRFYDESGKKKFVGIVVEKTL